MALIDGDDVVQQVAPIAFNPLLRDPVLPRTPERSSNRPDSHRANRDRDLQPILGIPIEDEKPGCPSIRKRLPQRLHDPGTGGMPRDVEMQDTPVVVADDEKAVEYTECDGRDREEVHCRNQFPVITQEGEPAFGLLGISRGSAHPAGDRSFTDIETQHQEFAMNARRAPGWVLRHHPEDQISDFFRDPVSSSWLVGLRDQAPIQLEACAMPTERCRRTTLDRRDRQGIRTHSGR